MSRHAYVVAVLAAVGATLAIVAGCPSSGGSKDQPKSIGVGEKVRVPGGAPGVGKVGEGGQGTPSGADDPLKLKAVEGNLAISVPSDAKAGTETVAHVVLTPGTGYHVNTEFPIKLTLESPTGVTLAKGEFVAGGMDKSKGDAESLDETKLDIAIKLTAATAGNYTISGKFKFAVCDATSCLPKKEQIAIAVAAK